MNLGFESPLTFASCYALATRWVRRGDLGGGYENLENSQNDKNSTNSLNSSKNSKENSQNSKIENSNNAKNTHPHPTGCERSEAKTPSAREGALWGKLHFRKGGGFLTHFVRCGFYFVLRTRNTFLLRKNRFTPAATQKLARLVFARNDEFIQKIHAF